MVNILLNRAGTQWLLLLLMCFALMQPLNAFAKNLSTNNEGTLSRADLLGLAKQFVTSTKSNPVFSQKQELSVQAKLDRIPDGEILLFQIALSKTLFLEGDVIGEKINRTLYLSFNDFVAVLFFPIILETTTKNATGWFIREENIFDLNWAERRVTTNEATFTIPNSVIEKEDDLLVPFHVLASWFGFTITPDPSNLLLEVQSDQPLPLERQLARRKRGKPKGFNVSKAELDRADDPYQAISIPVADITLGANYRRPPRNINTETERRISTTVIAAGDIAYHTGNLFYTGDNENNPDSIRFNLSRDSENPDLLGPLKARRYEAGDIVPTRLPFFGGGQQELGFRVTNKESDAVTSFNTTRFEGDLPPQWDVELYRNDQLIDFLTVEDNGRYLFDDVSLFAGDNKFRLVFYGPQGEIREEFKTIPVGVAQLVDAGGRYDFSASIQETETFQAEEGSRPEEDDISIAAGYERPLGENIVGNIGFRQRTFDEAEKTQFLAGLTTNVLDSLLTTNLGVDAEGEMGLQTSLRRSFGEHDVSLTNLLATDEFDPDDDAENPVTFDTNVTVDGPLFEVSGRNVNYNIGAGYQETADGENQVTFRKNINANIKPVRVNHTLNYVGNSDSEDRLDSILSLSGNLGKTRWRSTLNYDFEPESQIDSTFFQLSRAITPTIRGTAELEYRPEIDFTEGRLRANWNQGKFVMSPQLSLDSEDELRAQLTTRFGLAHEPRSGDIYMTERRQTGAGSVSAFVFLDRDGNGIFDGDDEPIPEARVDSLQTRRYDLTDESGLAFIQHLQEYKATDIRLDSSSLPDPFWIAGTDGVSIYPRPGHNVQLDFPVHIGGEIDGTVRIQRGDSIKLAKNITLFLYDLDGKIVSKAQTAFDGFYLFTSVPPGNYYLTFENNDLDALDVARPTPQIVTIGYDGTTIFGNDYLLNSGKDIPFTIFANYQDYTARHPHIAFPDMSDKTVILNLGNYKSQLMMALRWYQVRNYYSALIGPHALLVKPSQSLPDLKSETYPLRVHVPGITIDDAFKRCRSLTGRGIDCGIEFLPKGTANTEI